MESAQIIWLGSEKNEYTALCEACCREQRATFLSDEILEGLRAPFPREDDVAHTLLD